MGDRPTVYERMTEEGLTLTSRIKELESERDEAFRELAYVKERRESLYDSIEILGCELDDARQLVHEMWSFFEHEDPEVWDDESAQEIMALQYAIRALDWLYVE